MKFNFPEKHFSDISLTISYALWSDAKDTIGFNIENTTYLMYDSYCKNPDCDCTNAHLYFPELDGEKEYSLLFDYQTKEIIETDAPDELREKIENGNDLHEMFSIRHQLIKRTFEIEQNKRKINTLKSATQNLALKGAKIGRNEPCVCGSGKKYKNCCGK
jgi:hypothetical protein